MPRATAVLLLLGLSGLTAGRAAPADDLAAKRYDAYLAAVGPDFGARLATLAGVAIALDRTGGWDRPAGVAAAERLTPLPAARGWLAALRGLLGGDLAAVDGFFAGPAPALGEWAPLGDLLAGHGYAAPAAAVRAYGVLGSGGLPGAPDDGLLRAAAAALATLSPPQRDQVLGKLGPRLAAVPQRKLWLGTTVMQLAARATPDEAAAYAQLYLALGAGSGDGLLEQAARLANAGQARAALQLAQSALAARPASPDGLAPVLNARGLEGLAEQVAALYATALITWPAPQVRPVRVAWVRWLRRARPAELEAQAQAAGALAQADALLVSAGREPATFKAAGDAYAALVRDAARPLGERLDAWAGWLQVEPLAALPALDGLPWQPPHADLVRWTLQQCAPAAQRWLPFPPRRGTRELPAEVQQRCALLAASAQRLCGLVPAAALDGPVAGAQPPLRSDLAFVLVLGGQTDRALELLLAAPPALRAGLVRQTVARLQSAPVPLADLDRVRALSAQPAPGGAGAPPPPANTPPGGA